MVFLISNTVKATITAAVGELFFWRLRVWWISCWKSNIFIRKNYFVFIIYAQIYLQNFKTFNLILFFLNSQKFQIKVFCLLFYSNFFLFPELKFTIHHWNNKNVTSGPNDKSYTFFAVITRSLHFAHWKQFSHFSNNNIIPNKIEFPPILNFPFHLANNLIKLFLLPIVNIYT